ncbi:MAG TPA: ATPase, T2SS/T4P/T4SS family [Gemmatimonadaceae bacterium]|nr:ATPase, T2SS/T4P/T4SS family [Gemmatimonadaceae bacterium]
MDSPLAVGHRDAWLRPILAERLSPEVMASLDATGESYWEEAVRRDLVGDDELLTLIAERLRVKRATRLFVSSQARSRVSEELARKYRVLPLSVTDTTLEIATADPYDFDCERTLAFASGRAVRMNLASPLRIAERIDEVYRSQSTAARLLAGVSERYQSESGEEGDPTVGEPEHDGAEQPIVRLVDQVIAEGITARASDIHLEPGERGMIVRYRIDGVLREAMTIPRAVAVPLVSRIKIMSRLDIADRLRPQGGRAKIEVSGTRMDLRVSTLPVAHGEKVVIRILDQRETARTLDSLGFTTEAARRIRKLLDARDGLILVTGPTGSGKTTTLYAMLRQLQQRGVNIITVEDPVEYRIPGIVQVQVNEKAGLTFASALRTILRQDPDIVLIGEVRDRETATIAIQAALTGHLVFATLHTIDASTAVMRLLDLGVEREKISAALRGILAQRLLRRVCTACARGRAPRTAVCAGCSGRGYAGRIAIAEVVLSTPALERAISEGCSPESLVAVARRDGALPLWEAGQIHVESGDTTEEELRRVVERREEAEHGEAPYDSAVSDSSGSANTSTPIIAGVVDVYVLRRAADHWRVLVLQRADDTRCPQAWETVHGRIERGERPEEAALRELREETGLIADRLYSAAVQPFYLHSWGSVQLSIVFAAVVTRDTVRLSPEHQGHEWLSVEEANARFVWPRSRDALSAISSLLVTGDAGPVEDVLRVI